MPARFVAPHVGAWIEIPEHAEGVRHACVAPHAGAWIEMTQKRQNLHYCAVAPHAGAWIEMRHAVLYEQRYGTSRPTRARGLK